MLRTRRAAIAVLALSLCCPMPALGQSPSDIASARELFVEGAALSKEEQWLAAREKFEASLALKRAPITLYSLGVAQRETGQLVEALESFRAFLAAPSEAGTQAYVSPAKAAVTQLELRIAEIRLSITPTDLPDVRVFIDGELVPNAALSTSRIVNPGEHRIRVEAPHHEPAKSKITLAEGAVARIELALKPSSTAGSGTLPPPPPDYLGAPSGPATPPPQTTSTPWLGYGLVGGGAASLTTGIFLGIAALAQQTYANDPTGLEQEAAQDKALAADLFGAAGAVALVVGIVILVRHEGASADVVADGNGIGYRF